jgi:hypothetical protein
MGDFFFQWLYLVEPVDLRSQETEEQKNRERGKKKDQKYR